MSAWVTIIVAVIGSSAMGSLVALFAEWRKRRWKKEDDGTVRKEDVDKIVTAVDNMSDRLTTLEKKVDDNTEITMATANAQRVTITERVRYLGGHYIDNKGISLEDKATLHQMHDAAESLGVDGVMKTVMEEVDKLPVVKSRFGKGDET